MGDAFTKSRLTRLFFFALFFLLFLYNLPSDGYQYRGAVMVMDGVFLGLALFFLFSWMRAASRASAQSSYVRIRERD